LIADYIQFGDRRIRLERKPNPIDDDFAAVVATHDIDGNSHK